MEKRTAPMNFRPTASNRGKLEKAQALGFEMTELLNGMIERHFDNYVSEAARAKIQKLQKALAPR
jgi:hypothetical protein